VADRKRKDLLTLGELGVLGAGASAAQGENGQAVRKDKWEFGDWEPGLIG